MQVGAGGAGDRTRHRSGLLRRLPPELHPERSWSCHVRKSRCLAVAAVSGGSARGPDRAGVAPGTRAQYERLLVDLSRWLEARSIEPSALTADDLRRFVRWHSPSAPSARVPGLSRVLAPLRAEGVIPATEPSPDRLLLAEFARYLTACGSSWRLPPPTSASPTDALGGQTPRLSAVNPPEPRDVTRHGEQSPRPAAVEAPQSADDSR